MSDQTPSLTNLGPVDGRNLINVGGGTGITSINGDVTAAQVLSAGAGISIVDGGGGAHVISVTGGAGITSINGDGAVAQTIVAGSGITVTDLGAGAHRIAATGSGSGVTSINGDGAAAQTIVAGTGITVTDLGGGAHRIAVTGGGLVSINADATPAQTINGTGNISVANGGGGAHTISTLAAQLVDNQTTPGGIPVPANANTFLASITLPGGASGKFMFIFGAGLAGVTTMFMNVSLFKNGVFQTGIVGQEETTGQDTSEIGSFATTGVPGDVFAVVLAHNGPGAATTSGPSFIQAIRLS